jgi:predicted outer membrane repeat protein
MLFLETADSWLPVAGGYSQHFGEPIAVIIWNVKTRESEALFSGTSSEQSGAAIYGVAFSPDGDRLAAGIGKEIHIWPVPDGQLWKAIPSGFTGLIGDLA